MKKIFLLILLLATIPLNVSAELLLSSKECTEKDYDYLNFGDSGLKIFLCDIENIRRSNIRLKNIFNYFIDERCPSGFSEIDDYNLYVGNEQISACSPKSIESYENNMFNNKKLHARKLNCESGEEEYLSATQFVFCH